VQSREGLGERSASALAMMAEAVMLTRIFCQFSAPDANGETLT
jgi:hypothetical protein